MDTHPSTEEIRGYLRRRLTRDDFDKVGEHVHSCEICYRDFLVELQARFPIEIDLDELAGLQGWHLEGEELAAYVEGRMDELSFECASLHLEECSSCMEKTSAVFEDRLENPRVRMGARRKEPSTWSRYLPSVLSIPLPRLRIATAAVLLFALALIAWAVLQSKSEKSQLAGARPPETVSPDPSAHQPTVPVQPGPGSGSDNPQADSPMKEQLAIAAHSERNGVGRQEDEIKRALIAKDLAMPPAIEMLDKTPAIAVRGNHTYIESFSIVRPFSTIISEDRPTFSWTPLSGATSYTVNVYDANLNLVAMSEPLTETKWLMPDRLGRGTIYTWTVTAQKGVEEILAPPLPARAEFRVMEKSRVAELNRRINSTVSHAARGVLYAEAGLLDEAEREFQTHLTDQPINERVKKLLETVRSWRGTEHYPPPSPITTKQPQ